MNVLQNLLTPDERYRYSYMTESEEKDYLRTLEDGSDDGFDNGYEEATKEYREWLESEVNELREAILEADKLDIKPDVIETLKEKALILIEEIEKF